MTGLVSLIPETGHPADRERRPCTRTRRAPGSGWRLLEFAEQEAARHGLTKIRLYTHEVMTESQAVYARLGYQEVRRVTEDG